MYRNFLYLFAFIIAKIVRDTDFQNWMKSEEGKKYFAEKFFSLEHFVLALAFVLPILIVISIIAHALFVKSMLLNPVAPVKKIRTIKEFRKVELIETRLFFIFPLIGIKLRGGDGHE